MNGEIISPRVQNMLEAERIKQDAQWGGAEHDDGHSAEDWAAYILQQIDKLQARLEELSIYGDSQEQRETLRRARIWAVEDRMVKIAALAIAAAESQRRKQ